MNTKDVQLLEEAYRLVCERRRKKKRKRKAKTKELMYSRLGGIMVMAMVTIIMQVEKMPVMVGMVEESESLVSNYRI